MKPGQLCIGNSVVSIGMLGGIGAGLSTLAGGEVVEITKLVHDGRMRAFNRMTEEARLSGGGGLTGVSFDLINHGGNLELLTIGSTTHLESGTPQSFTTSADAQQLYCQLDSGFSPLSFVFGNIAYSIGVGGNLSGAFKRLVRGEVSEYTEIFDRTRHLALSRIVEEARRHGANAVIGIRTSISPLLGAQEMMMVGTASHHPALEAFKDHPITSDMTNEELWNMINLGYMPLELVMGVSVYSLGFKSGIISSLQSIGGGEVAGLTEILYEAREKALARIELAAEKVGADEVVGVEVRIYDLGGGLVEFMAIGTAVKKIAGLTTRTPTLPPQAVIQDRATFIESSDGRGGSSAAMNMGQQGSASAVRLQRGPFTIIGIVLFVAFYVFKVLFHFH